MFETSNSRRVLNCNYETFDNLETLCCIIGNADLSSQSQIESFSFTGSESEKSKTTSIWFENCRNSVDFLPEEIALEFHFLDDLTIWTSNIPILRETFFTENYKNLRSVDLAGNKIQKIEVNVFKKLLNLTKIILSYNLIEYIKTDIFSNNLNLQFIILNDNKIKSLNPRLFENLYKLRSVNLRGNQCVNINFGSFRSALSTTQDELNFGLDACFVNCKLDSECFSKPNATAAKHDR